MGAAQLQTAQQQQSEMSNSAPIDTTATASYSVGVAPLCTRILYRRALYARYKPKKQQSVAASLSPSFLDGDSSIHVPHIHQYKTQ